MSPSALRAETSFRYQSDSPENQTCHTDEGSACLACSQSTLISGTSFFSQLYFPSSDEISLRQMKFYERSLQAVLSSAPCGFAARSRVLARLVSLAKIGELARRLSYWYLVEFLVDVRGITNTFIYGILINLPVYSGSCF